MSIGCPLCYFLTNPMQIAAYNIPWDYVDGVLLSIERTSRLLEVGRQVQSNKRKTMQEAGFNARQEVLLVHLLTTYACIEIYD